MPTLRKLLGLKSKEEQQTRRSALYLKDQGVELLESLNGKMAETKLVELNDSFLVAISSMSHKNCDFAAAKKDLVKWVETAYAAIAERDMARAMWEHHAPLVQDAEVFSRDLVAYIKKGLFQSLAAEVDFIKGQCKVAHAFAAELEYKRACDAAEQIIDHFQVAEPQWKIEIMTLPTSEPKAPALASDLKALLVTAANSGAKTKKRLTHVLDELHQHAKEFEQLGHAKGLHHMTESATAALELAEQAKQALSSGNDREALRFGTQATQNVRAASDAWDEWKRWEDDESVTSLPFDLKRAKWYAKEGKRLGLAEVVAHAEQYQALVFQAKATALQGHTAPALSLVDTANKDEFQSAHDKFATAQASQQLAATQELIKSNPTGPEAKLFAALGQDDYVEKCLKSKVCMASTGVSQSVLGEGERLALWVYTSNDYLKINPMLRGNAVADDKERVKLETEVQFAVQAMQKLRVYKGLVMRGDDGWPGCDAIYQVDNIYECKAFLSTAVGSGFPGKYQCTIISKTGRMVAGYSNYPAESEVLFFPGTKLKVLARNDKSDGTVELTLEEV